MSRAAKVIFTVSILVNVLLIGAVGGHIFSKISERGEAWRELRHDLSDDTRDMIRRKMKENRKEAADSIRSLREKGRALEKVVVADEFSESDFDRVAGELAVLSQQMKMRRLDVFKSVLVNLPQEERAKIARKVSSSIVGKYGGKGKKGRKGGRDPKHGGPDFGDDHKVKSH